MSDIEQIKSDLLARYAEPWRHYHNATHVNDLLAKLDEHRQRVNSPDDVEWAIWFHDAVYDPRSATNEADSAALARRELDGVLSAARVDRVADLVLASKEHRAMDGDSDMALFLDLDLSILAAPADRYDAYVSQIRAEYSFVADDVFALKRGDLLAAWLKRPALFLSPVGAKHYEQAARANIARELRQMGRGG